MVSGKLLLVCALLLVLGTDSKPYNPFEDLVPSVASIYESVSYLMGPSGAEPVLNKAIEKREAQGYYYIPAPPPPPAAPAAPRPPSPPSPPENHHHHHEENHHHHEGSEENHS